MHPLMTEIRNKDKELTLLERWRTCNYKVGIYLPFTRGAKFGDTD